MSWQEPIKDLEPGYPEMINDVMKNCMAITDAMEAAYEQRLSLLNAVAQFTSPFSVGDIVEKQGSDSTFNKMVVTALLPATPDLQHPYRIRVRPLKVSGALGERETFLDTVKWRVARLGRYQGEIPASTYEEEMLIA